MLEKYLVRVDYVCYEVAKGGDWFVTENKPEIGYRFTEKKRPLKNHGCWQNIYRQSCDEDPSCHDQHIKEIRLNSKEELEKLHLGENIPNLEATLEESRDYREVCATYLKPGEQR